jgi:hypothetical protein
LIPPKQIVPSGQSRQAGRIHEHGIDRHHIESALFNDFSKRKHFFGGPGDLLLLFHTSIVQHFFLVAPLVISQENKWLPLRRPHTLFLLSCYWRYGTSCEEKYSNVDCLCWLLFFIAATSLYNYYIFSILCAFLICSFRFFLFPPSGRAVWVMGILCVCFFPFCKARHNQYLFACRKGERIGADLLQIHFFSLFLSNLFHGMVFTF